MADPQTSEKQFNVPTTGSDVGIWGNSMNANFNSLDSLLGGTNPIALSNANVSLTQTQANNLLFTLTGALAANVTVSFPAIGGLFIIVNETTGAFTVTINTTATGSVGVQVQQGSTQLIYLDGTNAYDAALSAAFFPSGTSMLFAQASAPTGWTQNTTNTDMALRVVNTTGGGTHGNVGLSAFLSNGALAHTLALSEIPVHSHGVNDPTHAHSVSGGILGGQGFGNCTGGSNSTIFSGTNVVINAAATGISIQDAGSGGSHTHSLSNLFYMDLIICVKN